MKLGISNLWASDYRRPHELEIKRSKCITPTCLSKVRGVFKTNRWINRPNSTTIPFVFWFSEFMNQILCLGEIVDSRYYIHNIVNHTVRLIIILYIY